MTMTTLAIYENGVLRPARALPFAEGETVQLTVTRPATSQEAQRRMREAKTLEELFDAFQSAPEADDNYDLLQALDENRKGERPLFPPELKGLSW